jgi:hypothetical protein
MYSTDNDFGVSVYPFMYSTDNDFGVSVSCVVSSSFPPYTLSCTLLMMISVYMYIIY